MKINQIVHLSEGVAGPKNCWPGYKKTGTQPGTGKNKDKRVNDCEKIKQKGVAEQWEPVSGYDTIYPRAKVIKSKNGKPIGEIYQDTYGWGCFHYKADNGADGMSSKEEALEQLKDMHNEHRQQGVAEAAKWRTHTDAHDLDTDGSYIPKGGIKSDNLAIRQKASKTQSEKDPKSMAGMFGAKYAKKHGVPTKQLMKNIPLDAKKKEQGVAEGSLNELSSDLLKRAAQAATDKRNQAMDPELHNALGGGYMNPLATHYDNVSQKMDNRAAQVRKKETIQKIASKIASPAVMRKMGMSGVAEGDVVPFPKKHPYELLTNCPKCGGSLQGGKDEKGRLKMCIPCMTLYRAPIQQGVAEGSVDKKPYPKTWHDVDPKIAKLVDKMSPEEKVKKGYSNPSILKKKKEQGVAEGQGSIVDKCASLAAKYFNSAGLQQQYDIGEYIKANVRQGVAENKLPKPYKKWAS